MKSSEKRERKLRKGDKVKPDKAVKFAKAKPTAGTERARRNAAMDMAVARSRSAPAVSFDPFKVEPKLHPPRVGGMAMDEEIADFSLWAGAAINGMFADGLTFQGYPYLSELAQRPEYRRISETLARHMTRKWIAFKAKGDEDKSDKISQLLGAMDKFGVQAAYQKAALLDGFFGRGHIFIDTGDIDDTDELKTSIGSGNDDTSRAKIAKGSIKTVRAVEPVWAYPTNYNANDPLRPDWYKPASWFVMAREVHHTRFQTFIGREVSDLLKPAYSFGGLSMSQMCKPYVDNWLRIRQSVADIVTAFSTFVLSMELGDALMVGGESLFKRAELFNNLRDNRGIMIIDKDDEAFTNVSAPLGTLDQLQAQAQEHMAAVSGIPIVLLLGISPAGLNASSEGELKAFYDWIHAQQELVFRPNLTRLIDMIQLSEFGEVDDDLTFDFVPLWGLDEGEIAEMQLREAQTDQIYVEVGALDGMDVRRKLAGDPDSAYPGLDLGDVSLPMQGEADQAPTAPRLGSDEWEENKHPRNKLGQFGRGSGAAPGANIEGFGIGRGSKDESVKAVLPKATNSDLRAVASGFVQSSDEDWDVEVNGVKLSNTEHAVTIDANGSGGSYLKYTLTRETGRPVQMDFTTLTIAGQGRGQAKALMEDQIAQAAKLGVDRISIHANMDVGGYTWARFGYAPDQNSWDELRAHLKRKVDAGDLDLGADDDAARALLASRDPHAIWPLSDLEAGKKLLLGTSWHGILDLGDEPTVSRLTGYLRK